MISLQSSLSHKSPLPFWNAPQNQQKNRERRKLFSFLFVFFFRNIFFPLQNHHWRVTRQKYSVLGPLFCWPKFKIYWLKIRKFYRIALKHLYRYSSMWRCMKIRNFCPYLMRWNYIKLIIGGKGFSNWAVFFPIGIFSVTLANIVYYFLRFWSPFPFGNLNFRKIRSWLNGN